MLGKIIIFLWLSINTSKLQFPPCTVIELCCRQPSHLGFMKVFSTNDPAVASDAFATLSWFQFVHLQTFPFPITGTAARAFCPKCCPELWSFIWGPRSSGTAEWWLETWKRQVASLSAWPLFIPAVVLVFPMAALAGSRSLNWSFSDDRAFLFAEGHPSHINWVVLNDPDWLPGHLHQLSKPNQVHIKRSANRFVKAVRLWLTWLMPHSSLSKSCYGTIT